MTEWKSINSAPKDGRWVMLGWLPNYPTVEHEVKSRWLDGKWQGNWTPTHWRPVP